MKRETKAERKFNLYRRLQDLGFTYEEACALRRIEMTLSRWSEMECGDESGRAIERDETTGKPYITYDIGQNGKRGRYAIADREAGALKRLKAIVDARNARATPVFGAELETAFKVYAYHQTDPRGCALYLISGHDLPNSTDEDMRRHSGEWPLKSEETRLQWKLSVYYTRGLAVCA